LIYLIFIAHPQISAELITQTSKALAMIAPKERFYLFRCNSRQIRVIQNFTIMNIMENSAKMRCQGAIISHTVR
jgi:hypothetical protein